MSNLATEEMTDCPRCQTPTFDVMCSNCQTPLYGITKSDEVKPIPYTPARCASSMFYPTEDDAYAELLHRLKDRAQAVEDRWQESIRRRFGI